MTASRRERLIGGVAFALALGILASACTSILGVTDVHFADAGADADARADVPVDRGAPDVAPRDSGADRRADGTGPCTEGATRCSGNGVETCGSMGQWSSAVGCTDQTCVAGACKGVCAPGQIQCSGSQPQICDPAGAWRATKPCDSSAPFCLNGSCTNPPSCLPGGHGMTNCGAGTESCCTSLEVEGGTFSRTYANNGDGGTGLADPTTVSGFRLDKYEVTVGRFRQFVSAVLLPDGGLPPPDGGAGFLPAAGSGKHTHLNGGQGLVNSSSTGGYETGWVPSDDVHLAPTNGNLACNGGYSTWTPLPGVFESLPMNCVNSYEAYAFCIWDGGFLPSEAEWEYAAAGGSQQREYPWGSVTPGTTCPGAGCYAIYTCDYPSGSGTCTGLVNVAPVGTATLGAGKWGQLDLGGSVREWILDWYSGYVDPCMDCAYLTSTANRVFRDGSFYDNGSPLMPANRYYELPFSRDANIGFRCARTP